MIYNTPKPYSGKAYFNVKRVPICILMKTLRHPILVWWLWTCVRGFEDECVDIGPLLKPLIYCMLGWGRTESCLFKFLSVTSLLSNAYMFVYECRLQVILFSVFRCPHICVLTVICFKHADVMQKSDCYITQTFQHVFVKTLLNFINHLFANKNSLHVFKTLVDALLDLLSFCIFVHEKVHNACVLFEIHKKVKVLTIFITIYYVLNYSHTWKTTCCFLYFHWK